MSVLKKISVIVCGYNEEKLLPRCMKSLLEQTLQEIEIILVDDASTDRTLALMQDYEKKYPDKVRVIHSDVNIGHGGAKYLGIVNARGEYIGSVDCDDWVEREMYELLYNEAIKSDSDICYCYRQQVSENGTVTADDTTYFLPVGTVSEQVRKNILANHVSFLQRYIYKRSLFIDNHICFPTNGYYDMVVDSLLIPNISRVAFVNKQLYNYFIRSGSIMTKRDETKYKYKILNAQFIVDEYKKRGLYEKYRDEVNYLYFRKGYIHTALNYILNAASPKHQTIEEIRAKLLSIDRNYRKNPYFAKKMSFRLIDYILGIKKDFILKIFMLLLKKVNYNV
ncbi:MAG: glycosyltransferase [Dysgonamonadaceae bacterium]|jgi:glycosyltransferase involved in cell wall biosynthesis|nr:glycosyltransferase [Dysgonamonadaceae bacterium]